MKIFKVLLVVAIAFGMMACNNEQGVPEISGEKDASISIKVFPSSKSAGVRAVGSLDGDGIIGKGLPAESKIFKLEAWVFVNGNLEKYSAATSLVGDLNEITIIEVSSGPRTVVVTANTNIGSQATLTLLEAAQYTLSQDITAGLPMTAESFEVDLVAGNNYYGYSETEVGLKTPATTEGHKELLAETPVALTRVNARVAIVEADLDLPESEEFFDALTDVEVAMFNVPKFSNLFGTPLAIDDDFLFGEDWPTTLNSYVQAADGGTIEGSLKEGTITFPIVNTLAPYFYVTENKATVENGKMLIVLRGKPTLGNSAVEAEGLYTDEEGYTYYPVWVNDPKHTYADGYVANNEIVRNTQYNIYLTIKGIGNPTIDPTETAFLDVKVVVKDWTVVTQEVEW